MPDVKQMYSGENSTGNTKTYIDEDTYIKRTNMISAPKAEYILEICGEREVKRWLDIGCGGG